MWPCSLDFSEATDWPVAVGDDSEDVAAGDGAELAAVLAVVSVVAEEKDFIWFQNPTLVGGISEDFSRERFVGAVEIDSAVGHADGAVCSGDYALYKGHRAAEGVAYDYDKVVEVWEVVLFAHDEVVIYEQGGLHTAGDDLEAFPVAGEEEAPDDENGDEYEGADYPADFGDWLAVPGKGH